MLSLVLPTYNEAKNLPGMLAEISQALAHLPHEIIVVDDDSPDETWKVAEDLIGKIPGLRVIRRIDARGLSSAVVRGFLEAKGDVLAVMDADGQHDTALIAKLDQAIRSGAGIAVGSRYVTGGDVGEWDGGRHILSKIATGMAMRVLKRSDMASVRDPMSGFFAIRADLFHDAKPRLIPKGFKILLDLLIHVKRGTTVMEVPLKFGLRRAGESKLNAKVQMDFLSYLYDVTLGRYVSGRVLLFSFIVAVIGLILLLRAWPIRLLYTDSALRAAARERIATVADQGGWLLSDIEIQRIAPQAVLIRHASRVPSAPLIRCILVLKSDRSIVCAEQ